MPKVIFWTILHSLKILKTQRESPSKSASRSKLPKLLKLKLTKHPNCTDLQLQEVLWFTSCSQTCPRFTHSTSIHSNHSLTSSTEPSIRSLKDLEANRECMRLTKMVMPSFRKLREERKTKRKLKWLSNTMKKKSRKKLRKNKTKKANKEPKAK